MLKACLLCWHCAQCFSMPIMTKIMLALSVQAWWSLTLLASWYYCKEVDLKQDYRHDLSLVALAASWHYTRSFSAHLSNKSQSLAMAKTLLNLKP